MDSNKPDGKQSRPLPSLGVACRHGAAVIFRILRFEFSRPCSFSYWMIYFSGILSCLKYPRMIDDTTLVLFYL